MAREFPIVVVFTPLDCIEIIFMFLSFFCTAHFFLCFLFFFMLRSLLKISELIYILLVVYRNVFQLTKDGISFQAEYNFENHVN